MYQNGSVDCVCMDECRTSRSDESPANILVFWREDILDLSMIEANAQFISTNAKIKSFYTNTKVKVLSLRTPPFCSRKLSKVVYRGALSDQGDTSFFMA